MMSKNAIIIGGHLVADELQGWQIAAGARFRASVALLGARLKRARRVNPKRN